MSKKSKKLTLLVRNVTADEGNAFIKELYPVGGLHGDEGGALVKRITNKNFEADTVLTYPATLYVIIKDVETPNRQKQLDWLTAHGFVIMPKDLPIMHKEDSDMLDIVANYIKELGLSDHVVDTTSVKGWRRLYIRNKNKPKDITYLRVSVHDHKYYVRDTGLCDYMYLPDLQNRIQEMFKDELSKKGGTV